MTASCPSFDEEYVTPDDHPVSVPSAGATTGGGSRPGGRFAQLRSFVGHTLRTVARRNDVAVWVVLFDATNADDGTATVSHGFIAERVGCDESTVKRAVKRLKDAGLVSVVRQDGYRTGPSSYRVRSVAG